MVIEKYMFYYINTNKSIIMISFKTSNMNYFTYLTNINYLDIYIYTHISHDIIL